MAVDADGRPRGGGGEAAPDGGAVPRGGGEAAPRWFAVVLLALAVVTALALVGRPAGLGLALLGAALCVAAAVAARRRDPWTVACWLLAAALAAVPALRAAGWVWVTSVVAAALLASLAASGGRGGRQVAVGLLAGVRWLPLGPPVVLAPLGKAADRKRLRPALRGGVLAAVLLAVFVPLFASADAAFAEILERAVPQELPVDRALGRAIALLAVIAAGGALLLASRHGPARHANAPKFRLARLEWALPLGALVALFAAFVALQLTTLFAGHDHVLRTAGLTYAEYARQGFGQLIAAAGLTLAVIAGARRWACDERLLRGLLAALCVLCLVVLASALKRLGLYEQAFGFTRLRLVAGANILWLGAVLVLAAVATGSSAWLPRALVAVSAVGALAFALSNPDGRIAERNLERGRADLAYLSGLSADAAPALARAPCALDRIRRELERSDGLAGANLARARARVALRRSPEPVVCPAWLD